MGISVFMGCVPEASAPCKSVILEHVGGMPFANRWVIPLQESLPLTGWWSGSIFEATSDTLYTDHEGKIDLLGEHAAATALVCEPLVGQPAPYLVRIPSATEECNATTSLQLPQTIWFNITGNRLGHYVEMPVWVRALDADSAPDPDHWFTPGVPPRPNHLVQAWIHPGTATPLTRRFSFHAASGMLLAEAVVAFDLEDLLDTVHVSLIQ